MKQPNIFFIMTDQQRWDAMGCVNPVVRTPALDSLARNGILFDQAVCQCPMCVPSRNSLLLGLNPWQVGVRNNGQGILDDAMLPNVPLPQMLRDAGYRTAGFGKTHWNNGLPGRPGTTRGFEVRAEGQSRESRHNEIGAVMMDDEDAEGLKAYYEETSEFGSGEENALGYIGKVSRLPKEHHRDGFIYKKCAEFLDGYEPDGRPLFLYFSLIKPHAGFNIPPEYESQYRLEDIPDAAEGPFEEEPEDTHMAAAMRASESLYNVHHNRKKVLAGRSREEKRLTTLRYWANCTFMDDLIGGVLRKIHEKGLDEDALFVFVSDHGEMLGERDSRFSKYCLFDSSVRVPMILAGSRVPEALRGTRDHRPAMLLDVYPTLRAAAGLKDDPALPGLNLLASCPAGENGDTELSRREGAFCEFHGGGAEKVEISPAWMYRTPRYKLILFREGCLPGTAWEKGELYDLEKDPHEWHNVYGEPEYGEVRRHLTERLSALIPADSLWLA